MRATRSLQSSSGRVRQISQKLPGSSEGPYVEEGALARLYREAPLNAIWEGSGNVMCLDVLRALSRDGEAGRAVLGAIASATADLPGATAAVAFVTRALTQADAEAHARSAVERIAILAAAAALRDGGSAVAETFARARLAEGRSGTYGTAVFSEVETARLIDRALPA